MLNVKDNEKWEPRVIVVMFNIYMKNHVDGFHPIKKESPQRRTTRVLAREQNIVLGLTLIDWTYPSVLFFKLNELCVLSISCYNWVYNSLYSINRYLHACCSIKESFHGFVSVILSPSRKMRASYKLVHVHKNLFVNILNIIELNANHGRNISLWPLVRK